MKQHTQISKFHAKYFQDEKGSIQRFDLQQRRWATPIGAGKIGTKDYYYSLPPHSPGNVDEHYFENTVSAEIEKPAAEALRRIVGAPLDTSDDDVAAVANYTVLLHARSPSVLDEKTNHHFAKGNRFSPAANEHYFILNDEQLRQANRMYRLRNLQDGFNFSPDREYHDWRIHTCTGDARLVIGDYPLLRVAGNLGWEDVRLVLPLTPTLALELLYLKDAKQVERFIEVDEIGAAVVNSISILSSERYFYTRTAAVGYRDRDRKIVQVRDGVDLQCNCFQWEVDSLCPP